LVFLFSNDLRLGLNKNALHGKVFQ